ncbi:MAG: hypothetical protein ACI3T9_01015 [Romboutsia timonensis]
MIAKGVQYNIAQDYEGQKATERISRKLGKLSYTARKILEEEFDNHCMIIVSKDGLRLVRDEMVIPIPEWEKENAERNGDNFYE